MKTVAIKVHIANPLFQASGNHSHSVLKLSEEHPSTKSMGLYENCVLIGIIALSNPLEKLWNRI